MAPAQRSRLPRLVLPVRHPADGFKRYLISVHRHQGVKKRSTQLSIKIEEIIRSGRNLGMVENGARAGAYLMFGTRDPSGLDRQGKGG